MGRSFINGFLRSVRKMADPPMYWGDGSDGILSAGVTYLAGDEGDFDKYSGFCIKQFSEINWTPGSAETLTVDEPCRGLILLVNGNVNIGEHATISMAKMGSVLPTNPSELFDLYGGSKRIRHIVDTMKTLKGGAGGDGGDGGQSNSGTPGVGGTGGEGRNCQGGRGGGGGASVRDYSAGNGGSVIYPEILGYPGFIHGWNGGGGGFKRDNGARPGGAPWGAGGGGSGCGPDNSSYRPGEDGEHTGGFILIIARGSITIEGKLDVTGGNGGNGGSGYVYGGGGGGAGGGVIAVFAQGHIDTISATKTLTGGAGGSGYQNGTAGGDGTYYEEKI